MTGEGGLGSERSAWDTGITLLLRRGLGGRVDGGVFARRRTEGRRAGRMRVLGRLLDAVEGFEDVAHGGGRGHLAARLESPTVLDHHDDYQGLLLVLGPTNEPVHEISSDPRLARAALADNIQLRVDEGAPGRSLAFGDPPQTLYGVQEVGVVDAHLARGFRGDPLDQLAVLVANLAPHVRGDEGAAVLDGGVAADELDRGDEQVALADGEVDPVSDAPEGFFRRADLPRVPRLPLARGHPPGRLPLVVYSGRRTEAEPLVELGVPVLVVGAVPDLVRHLVEELVVRDLDGLGVVLGAVGSQGPVIGAVLAPALPATPGGACRAPALALVGDGRVGVDDAEGETGHPGEYLERRCRRVGTGYGAVGERRVGVLGVEILEGLHLLGAGDAAHEELRVEVGSAGEGQDLSVARIHRDDGTPRSGVACALGALDGSVELGLCYPLQIEVHG